MVQDAICDFDAALALDPQNVVALTQRGYARFEADLEWKVI